MTKLLCTASALALLTGIAMAQGNPAYQGQVNVSGATLFADYFDFAATNNDSIGIDADSDCLGNPYILFDPARFGAGCLEVDSLAPNTVTAANAAIAGTYGPNQLTEGWWAVQYRSVGSIEGYTEWTDFQACGTIPTSVPSERGLLNGELWSFYGLPAANASGTPLAPTSIDGASSDVPSVWVLQGGTGMALWSRNPGDAGYGQNPTGSCDTGASNQLPTLIGQPCGTGLDPAVVTDNTFNWSPINFIANRGTGLQTVAKTDLQYLYVTGRMPSGLNLVGATRDIGSGTRNGAMNTTGIDPSWGRGDNRGDRVDSPSPLGPNHQSTNCGGSSIMEEAVRWRRLAVGYTGTFGGSRAVADANSGRYELLDIINNLDGGTTPVRISIGAIVNNCDPDAGWRVGGPQTITTYGDPFATDYDWDNDGTVDFAARNPGNTPMTNLAAAAYFVNVITSIENFDPILPAEQFQMPGQIAATIFTPLAGIDCLPIINDPTTFVPNANLNLDLQNYIIANNPLSVPAYGSVNAAGQVPARVAGTYIDGVRPVNQYAYNAGGSAFTINSNSNLPAANALQGDLDRSGTRTTADIAAMISAINDWAAYENSVNADNTNPVIVAVTGDLTGDGTVDAADVRYYADGLILTAGQLDRVAGFNAVDAAQANFFGTVIDIPAVNPGNAGDPSYGYAATPNPAYTAGASRFDIAGNAACAGAEPVGSDGLVDLADYDYVAASFGDWSDLDQAANMDLSADMNADLVVDGLDLCGFYSLWYKPGDANLDGVVDFADFAIVSASFGVTLDRSNNTWASGDFNCDGTVDFADFAALSANFGL